MYIANHTIAELLDWLSSGPSEQTSTHRGAVVNDYFRHNPTTSLRRTA